MKIINIKKKAISFALVVSTIITGLSLSNTVKAADNSEAETSYTIYDDNNKDIIFESYIMNYYLHQQEGVKIPPISEYYNFIEFIRNAILNSEKNKQKPYNDEIILKVATLYAKEYFSTLYMSEFTDINIPSNIGENLYDVIPTMAAYYYISDEDSQKVETYKQALQSISIFYKDIYPTLNSEIKKR